MSSDERNALLAWAAAGGPRNPQSLHGAAFADPRSPASHGQILRAKLYEPMLDPAHEDACGACHAGAPRAPSSPNVTSFADAAPACTSCHREPAGVLACSTCHGSGTVTSAAPHAFPPRNACFFPTDQPDKVHAAHVEKNALRGSGLACTTCHPEPTSGDDKTSHRGVHANGHVEVWFDYALAGRDARVDQAIAPASAPGAVNVTTCAGTTCHSRGGARPSPTWKNVDGLPAPSMTCNDCHSSPPANHYKGACTTCHREANDAGTALTTPLPALHINGKVDLGDGSGRCGACHGTSADPTAAELAWPGTGAHARHVGPTSTTPIACDTCHVVPDGSAKHPVGKGAATVRFGFAATRGGRRPTYDPATKTCSGTYCHEGNAATRPAPQWVEAPPSTCSAGICHATPPPAPHVQTTASCGGTTCHEGSTTGTLGGGDIAFTAKGRAAHLNGVVDRGLP